MPIKGWYLPTARAAQAEADRPVLVRDPLPSVGWRACPDWRAQGTFLGRVQIGSRYGPA